MGILQEGQVATFFLELLFCIGVYIMISRARKGLRVPEVRKVAGLEALDEAVGRATEMGRPVHYSPGIGSFDNAQTLASFGILSYVAAKCARYSTRLIVSNRNPVVYGVTDATVRQAYLSEGKLEEYNPTDVRFISDQQFGYASGVMGIMHREKVATNILMGAFWAESLIFAEVGSQVGAIQIAGTANTHQIPFFVAACDYTLIGEELYAAAAYFSKDPVLIGNLIGQDYGKIAGAIIIIIGALVATTGSDALTKLLSK